jgi:hypothetical protein
MNDLAATSSAATMNTFCLVDSGPDGLDGGSAMPDNLSGRRE